MKLKLDRKNNNVGLKKDIATRRDNREVQRGKEREKERE